MRHAPGSRVFVIPVTNMEDLPQSLGTIAVLFEELRQSQRIRGGPAEVRSEIVDARGGGAQAGEQGIAGWSANGLVTVRPLEQHPARGEPVHAGGLDDPIAIAAEQGLEIIHADELDVGLGRNAARFGA